MLNGGGRRIEGEDRHLLPPAPLLHHLSDCRRVVGPDADQCPHVGMIDQRRADVVAGPRMVKRIDHAIDFLVVLSQGIATAVHSRPGIVVVRESGELNEAAVRDPSAFEHLLASSPQKLPRDRIVRADVVGPGVGKELVIDVAVNRDDREPPLPESLHLLGDGHIFGLDHRDRNASNIGLAPELPQFFDLPLGGAIVLLHHHGVAVFRQPESLRSFLKAGKEGIEKGIIAIGQKHKPLRHRFRLAICSHSCCIR